MAKGRVEVFTAGCPVCDKVECCKVGAVDAAALKAAGVGRA